MQTKRLEDMLFSNQFCELFDGVKEDIHEPRQTPGALYSYASPTIEGSPRLLGYSSQLFEELSLSPDLTDTGLNILSGVESPKLSQPYALCYGGHQFGHWAGQLGDGRAINLGSLSSKNGSSYELQLKGAGRTVYSRGADGRAVLRSSLREFLMSEAMAYLGVPTTRALSIALTGEKVLRDVLYDGNPAYEPGAVVVRTSKSFLRFGSFEILAARGETENLRRLFDFTLDRYYPKHKNLSDRRSSLMGFLSEIIRLTAVMIAHWARVGFVHGVMNTDNMSVLGETIDFGPYSMLDEYDEDFTPNTTDLPGKRYAFSKQSAVARWNIRCLAHSLSYMFDDRKEVSLEIERLIDSFDSEYENQYFDICGKKFGFERSRIDESAKTLINRFYDFLSEHKLDHTLFFRALTFYIERSNCSSEELFDSFKDCFYGPGRKEADLTNQAIRGLEAILSDYQVYLEGRGYERKLSAKVMSEANPAFILRNYQLHTAAKDIETGDDSLFKDLLGALKSPYDDLNAKLSGKKPDWARGKAGCSMLSCSS